MTEDVRYDILNEEFCDFISLLKEGFMPLVKIEDNNSKMVPDASGGWYWIKFRNEKSWRPVFVDPAARGWPASINHYSHTVDVKDVAGEWGPQIYPPE